ncbi:MAG: efflux RND transporter permease subunit [Candidatus Neomarinimicrobiota bacterium]
MKNFIEYFIKHRVISNWVMFLIGITGVFALFNLQKRINPKYEEPYVTVAVPWPGASPIELEEGIMVKIEEALKGLEGLKDIWSQSHESYGEVTVEVDDKYDMNRAIQVVKNAVNSISSYPAGAEKPIFYQETVWNRAISLSVYGPDDLFTTKKIIDEFRDDLTRTGKISNTMTWGLPDREISIEIAPDVLEKFKLTIDDIARAIRNSNLNISSGSVLTEQEEILIRSYGKKYQSREFEDIEIVSGIDGTKIKLVDICSIKEQWPENQFYSEFNNRRSVTFNVMYNNYEDVVEIVEITERIAKQYNEKYAGLITFETFIKETDDLQERLRLLIQNGLIGFVLIMLLLGVFLNLRMAFWVALSIPISFLGMFFVIWLLGISINEMSLFGMILVVGILVDDGIIIGESIFSQAEKGKNKFQAAVDGTLDVIKPVSIAILTTIVAFTPYFYFYGRLGDFVWQIGAIVITSLCFSLLEATIILPGHLEHSKALEFDRNTKANKKSLFAYFRKKFDAFLKIISDDAYGKFLKFCLRNRWSVTAATLAIVLLILGLFQGAHVRAQFFPEMEFPFARIAIAMPAGASAKAADEVRKEVIEKALSYGKIMEEEDGINPIEKYVSWGGRGDINIFLDLIPSSQRDWSVNDFLGNLSDYIGTIPQAENVNIRTASFGGSPVSTRLLSTDYSQLLKAKNLLKEELQQIAGLMDIRDDTPLGNNEFIVTLKPRAEALGFTLRDVTTQLRQGFFGQEVMRMQRGRDELRIWVRFNKENRVSISQIENLRIRTPMGEYIPFKEIAKFKIERGIRTIRRENRLRSIRVNANMDFSKNNLQVVLEELNTTIIPRVLSQVDGVTETAGGQSEYTAKMVNSITSSMTFAVIAIFTILVFLLKSYMQTGLILTLIPLGVIGAVIGHYIMGIPVSILSFLGIVALAGIIINDSIVLIDRYNKMIKAGVKVSDALYQAGMTRFRPIVLTTLTTAVGLAPLILQKSQQGQWLVPMALSVAAGLIFGTFITLLMLPSGIYCISDLRVLKNRFANKFMGRELIERSDLEPARK